MTTEIFTLLLLLVPIIAWTYFRVLRLKSSNLPPGPFPLPIVGSLLQLGKNPHQTLAELSKKFGPLMHLKLGSMHTIVVSSPEMAKEVLQKHDRLFSNRTIPNAARAANHHKWSVAFLPATNKWRSLRKICKEHMFSKHKLDASKSLRQEKLQKLHDYVQDCCASRRVLDIGEAVFITSLNLISCTLCSTDFADFNLKAATSKLEIKETVQGLMRTLGKPNLSDYFPLLNAVDPQGIKRESEVYTGRILAKFDEIISSRLDSRRASTSYVRNNDLLEELLDLNKESDTEFSINDLKHMLFDLFLAGVDTTAVSVEWAMTELIRNPQKMLKAKSEIRDVIAENKQVEESDIERLPYLNAVIKETFRLHPAGPFLLPHISIETVEINGYTIPKDSQILVNVWAMGRDQKIWTNAELFEPERFLDSKIDYRGQDFELIPFGSGRRICPGMPLAHRMVHLTVAYLIHGFHWKLESEMDMTEKFGLSLHKAMPLHVVPIKS